LVFFIIINNGIKTELIFEDFNASRDWLGTFQQHVRETDGSYRERRSGGASSMMNSIKAKAETSYVDYNMLDFLLDFFMRHLMQGILPDKDKQHSETLSPDHQNMAEVKHMLRAKRNMIDVMSECMEMLQPDMNIR
jgi:hypothetical protein